MKNPHVLGVYSDESLISCQKLLISAFPQATGPHHSRYLKNGDVEQFVVLISYQLIPIDS